jgi:hypothetical protein
MLKSKIVKTDNNLPLIRQNNLKLWDDDDRAFYENFLNDVPDNEESDPPSIAIKTTDRAWQSFKKIHQKLSTSQVNNFCPTD